MQSRHSIAREARHFIKDATGNFAIIFALLLPIILVCAGGALDISLAYKEKVKLQSATDAAALSAAQASGSTARQQLVASMLAGNGASASLVTFTATTNSDNSLTVNARRDFSPYFLGMIGLNKVTVSVSSTAIASAGSSSPSSGACIYVLGNTSQAVLINSGANVHSAACEIHEQSVANPAFIMNSGSTIATKKFCVKGTQYIKNGGTLNNLQTGCAAATDPFAGALTEPADTNTCTTSGPKDGSSTTIPAGVDCNINFNGSQTITFSPGLHIVKGTININSGSTIIANGVTFYFPDPWSYIQFNGGVTITGSAPTTGPYKGLFMFEKTSNASYNTNKTNLVFNGTNGESINGIMYLPNRNVTYNSTSNATNNITLVVNTLIMNSSNWSIEPYTAASPLASSAVSSGTRLVK